MKKLIIIFIIAISTSTAMGSENDHLAKSYAALEFEADTYADLATVEVYEVVGYKLTKFFDTARKLGAEKKLSADLQGKLKLRYNRLRNQYIKAGNLIINGIKDDTKKADNIKKYRAMKKNILKELSELNKLIGIEHG